MKKLKVGTRGSPLALIQANTVCAELKKHDIHTQLVIIKTSGDKNQTSPLAEIGGKVLFAKELQHALLTDETQVNNKIRLMTFNTSYAIDKICLSGFFI